MVVITLKFIKPTLQVESVFQKNANNIGAETDQSTRMPF